MRGSLGRVSVGLGQISKTSGGLLECLCPHQLRFAPADAVAGDLAEAAASRDPDFSTRPALLLVSRLQDHQQAGREGLRRAHLYIHTDTQDTHETRL